MKKHFFLATLMVGQLASVSHGQCLSPAQAKVAKPASAAPKQVKPILPAIRDKWAVLIGVGRYEDTDIGLLKYANSNVLKVAKVFVDPDVGRFPSNHVLVVTQDKANKASINQAVCEDWLYKKALPNDLIVFYICMRGTPSDSMDDWLLLGADSTLANKNQTAISLMGMLGDLRKRTQSKNLVCILDTQIAGDKNARSSNQILKKIAESTQTTILTADENLLQSQNSANGASSSFVEYLTEGMKAGGGLLPLDTVAGFISESMAKEAPAESQKPALLVSAANAELVKVPLGIPIKNTSSPLANVRTGHSINKLDATNPELAKDARRMLETPDPNSAAGKIQQLLTKEQQALQDDDGDDQDGPEVDFGPYMKAMKKAIQAKWASPKGFDQKKVVTAFSIQRDGRITEAEVVESSGSADIDKTAMQALKDASPLAPLPKGAPKRVQIRYKFDYQVK